MSGIVGVVNRDGAPADADRVRYLTEFLAFRGPDAQVVWSEGPAAFGNALLRISGPEIDERQPISLDGRIWITAEARLDDRAGLIRRLSERGQSLAATASDAQLILAAYRVWDEQCLDYLAGDFSFALWDQNKQRLFCARDQFGVRPFFYAQHGQSLWFSNTLACLRQHPDLAQTLDEVWLGDWLVADYCLETDRTAFADVKRLPPAHFLTFDSSGFHRRRYWVLPSELPLLKLDEAACISEFRGLVSQAIADRLPVPAVSVFMSGGLDSTLVAGFARQSAQTRFGTSDVLAHSTFWDRVHDEEKVWAPRAAAGMNVPMDAMRMDDFRPYPGWGGDHLESASEPNVVRNLGFQPEPVNYPLLQTLVESSRRVAKHARICMTGHGGDPALAWPKDYFFNLLRKGRWARVARESWNYRKLVGRFPYFGFRWRLFGRNQPQVYPFPDWLNPEFTARLNLPERWRHLTEIRPSLGGSRPEARFQLSEHMAWDSILQETDAGLMGVPLSMCHPLFDLRIITFLLSLPPFPWCVEKEIFRRGTVGILPDEIRARPKSPFRSESGFLGIQQLDTDIAARYILPQELDPFIHRPSVFSMEKLRRESIEDMPWVHYRPYSFAYWLLQQECLRPKPRG
jgi:asparagine synthase (glutamine-hydrolysing)